MTQRVGAGGSPFTTASGSSQVQVTELKLPAHPDYIVVAKRAVGALGLIGGFSLEAIDEFNIATTQACESAVAAASALWGPGNGQLKLLFKSQRGKLEVEVRSVPPRAEGQLPPPVPRRRPVPGIDYESIGLNMIGLFVDELRYHVDNHTGSLRMRMVKYLIE